MPGATRTLYLGLPLLVGMSTDELRAVISHEMAHYAGGHARTSMLMHRGVVTLDAIRGALQLLIVTPPKRRSVNFRPLMMLSWWFLYGYALSATGPSPRPGARPAVDKVSALGAEARRRCGIGSRADRGAAGSWRARLAAHRGRRNCVAPSRKFVLPMRRAGALRHWKRLDASAGIITMVRTRRRCGPATRILAVQSTVLPRMHPSLARGPTGPAGQRWPGRRPIRSAVWPWTWCQSCLSPLAAGRV